MKKNEIKKVSTDELKTKINLLKKDLFNFRFRKVNAQLEDTAPDLHWPVLIRPWAI